MIFVSVFFVVNTSLASQITPGKVIQMVNESRKSAGILPVEENEILSQIAAEKLSDMVEKKYFAHYSPSGISPWYWFEKNKYDYKYAGENLAINFETVEEQHDAWMKSPTHRKNILNPNYQQIGVAVAAGDISGQTSIIAVQEFGTLMSAKDAPAVKKTEDGNLKNQMDPESLKPTVLSVRDVMKDDNLKVTDQSGVREDAGIFNKFRTDRYELAVFGYQLALFLFIISVLVAPMTVLIYSMEKAINNLKTRTKIGAA